MMAKSPANQMKRRMAFVLAMMLVAGFGTLVVQLYRIQIQKGEEYQQMALKQQLRSTTISAQRGNIYDTNMKTLAASATVWTVNISPAEIESEEQLQRIAQRLSEILEVDAQRILERGQNKESYYETIKSRVEKDVADQVLQFVAEEEISGVYLEEDTRRYYPYGSLASTVLGFTDADNRGAYGLEAYYNKTLSGTPGMVVSAKNARGTDMPFRYQELYDPQDGNSLVLTIDEVIQHFLEKHLETAVVENNVQNRACGIVMDVKTGAILAMATKPDFDPNNPQAIGDPAVAAYLQELKESGAEDYNAQLLQAQFDQWRNKAISDPYEPGSVFKIITGAGALESDSVSLSDTYYCPGYYIVAGRRKSCWKAAGHGTVDFTQAVKFSCNPAFMMIGERMGPQVFYDNFEAFGLLEPTRIDLPGEAESIFYDYETLAKPSGEELASSAFGQTFKVTPLQLVTAVAAVLNDGKLMQPYIVKQIIDSDGNVISSTEPVVKRQVISQETSDIMCQILEKVVGDPDGSGKMAYLPGYRVGGKTGTSEKLDSKENGEVTKRISSFLGFAPADDPQVVVLVMLDEAYMENIYGSVIAAPVVGSILGDILPYIGVEPSYTEAELAQMDVAVPFLTGSKIHDAIASLNQVGLKSKVVGDGESILRQVPGSGEPMPRGGTVLLYTEEDSGDTTVTVPDVVGMSGQQANRTILNASLNLKIVGYDIDSPSCVAERQSPAAGEQVEAGTVITVEFIDQDVAG